MNKKHEATDRSDACQSKRFISSPAGTDLPLWIHRLLVEYLSIRKKKVRSSAKNRSHHGSARVCFKSNKQRGKERKHMARDIYGLGWLDQSRSWLLGSFILRSDPERMEEKFVSSSKYEPNKKDPDDGPGWIHAVVLPERLDDGNMKYSSRPAKDVFCWLTE